ncbi:MAG: alpha/beta hydrolase [Caulobacterales bacterium]
MHKRLRQLYHFLTTLALVVWSWIVDEEIRTADDSTRSPRVVRSTDGASISYFTTGRGPGVIAIPGALSTAADYFDFAEALGRTHTVHTIERRGRGLSGPQGDDYGMDSECEDVAALMAETGSVLLFGHSYGGLVALEAARRDSSVSKVAVYEPGVSIAGSIANGWIDSCERSLREGNRLEAFAIFSIGAGPKRARSMPIWLMKLLLPLVVERGRLGKLLELLPTTLPEHRVIAGLDGSYPLYGSITAEVLLMAGDKSDQDWVGLAMGRLSAVIPSVELRMFPKLDHFGPDQSGPLDVAAAVAVHFANPSRQKSNLRIS